MAFNIESYSDTGMGLGEGPHWSPETKQLYYVDIINGIVGTIGDDTRQVNILVNEKPHVSAVFPVDGKPNQIVYASGQKIYLKNIATGEKSLLNQLESKPESLRFNDAKCDAKGRLWIGTMGDPSSGEFPPEQGSLYVRSSERKLVEKLNRVTGSNGIAWSLDSKFMYYIDTGKRFIYKFYYDLENAKISNCTIFVDMNKDDAFVPTEMPDGMTIDIAGNLWVAMVGGSRVVNIDGQTGKVIESIHFPTTLITSACFGGPNLDQLFVTSIKYFLNEEQKAKEPLAGFIFKVTSKNQNFKGFKANFAMKL